MRRAAIYARYSTDLQSPTSIEDQVRLCEQYAERHGLIVVVRYQDAAISGATNQRPGYQDLVSAACARLRTFDTILCEGLDRLTRDAAEATILYRRLRARGVSIVGVSDGTDTSRKGAALQVAVSGIKNAVFLEDLSEKTHRGMMGRVVRGLTAGGRLFGYRVVDGRREIIEAQATIVLRVWREYAEGRSQEKIAHQLNDERVPFPSQHTQRGAQRKGWAPSTVRTILLNETYCGRVIWNRSQFLKDPDGRRQRVARPPEDWHVSEHPELRIIPPELEVAVKARLASVREAYEAHAAHARHDGKWIPVGRAAAAYPAHLLSGLLRCDECGMAIVVQTTTRRKGNRVYRQVWYRCAGAKDKGPSVCRHSVPYRQDHLEGALIARLREATARPETIERLTELVNARVESSMRSHGAQAETLEKEIDRLERQGRNLLDWIAKGKVQGDNRESSLVREELRRLEGELERQRIELAVLVAARQAMPVKAHPARIRDPAASPGPCPPSSRRSK